MKKGLILLGFAIVALSSCTKDTTKVVNNGHAIDFRAATTKGASLDYTYDLNSFFATAIDANDANYFTNAGLVVYPAAGFVDYFKGNHLVVLNKTTTSRDVYADLCIQEPIGEVLGSIII